MQSGGVVTDGTRVVLRPLVTRREGDRLIVGWIGGGVFFEVDEATAEALRLLGDGATVGEVKSQLKAETGEDHDVTGLVESLHDASLVVAVDGVPVEGREEAHHPDEFSPSRALRWLHSTPFAILALLAAIGSALLMVRDPGLVPGIRDLLSFTSDPLVGVAVATFLSLAIVVWHELGHWAVARSFGIRSRIGFSARFVIPVMQTDVTQAWVLPRTERVLIFLGGMIANVLLISGTVFTVVLLESLQVGSSQTVRGIGNLVVFLNLFQIIYQFILFLRTDLYYVFITVTGEWNLHTDVAHTFRDAATRIARTFLGRFPTEPTSTRLGHERSWFVSYACLLALGTGGGLTFMAYVLGQISTQLVPRVATTLHTGVVRGNVQALMEGGLLVAYLGFLATLVIRFWVLGLARGVWRWGREVLREDEPTQG